MNFFKKFIDNLYKALRVVGQRGFRAASQAVYVKMVAKINRSPHPPTVQDWLFFYQRRNELRHWMDKEIDSDKFPKVSILIITYNNLFINQLCLHSLYCNTTYPNFEVIVVDNASSDKTPVWLKTYAETHPNLKVILNLDNLGFSGGNNQAAREATGEYLIFLNNDTIVTLGWVERLLAHIQKDPKIGLIGPVTNSTGNEACIPVDYSSPAEMESFASDRAQTMAGQAFDIRMLAFYCVMTRKDRYETLGGLDERYAVGMFEDDDLAVRYHHGGFRVVCAEDVFIHHFQGASFGKLDSDKYKQIFEENRKKYEEKWGREWQPYQQRQILPVSIPNGNLTTISKPWGTLRYQCNICGRECETPVADLGREKPSCVCGSTVRSRAIVHLLSSELFGSSMALPDFPLRSDLHGWGMSDAIYSDLLPHKLSYVNTFYHQSPYLDITAPLEPAVEGSLDFFISTEVFEHIAPPVSIGFENVRKLLKPTGVLIFTVPYTLEPSTREHFSELYRYELIDRKSELPVLKNITRDGRGQVFDNLIFHGGTGATLEMRVFSRAGLLAELAQAGFGTVRICSESYWEFGIYWQDPWSLPLIARPV